MIWSTPMWNFFHTMCEKCENDSEKLKKLYELIQYVSNEIPCYMCKKHASNYLHKNKEDSIFLSKNNLKLFFYNFHNSVKQTRKLKLDPPDILNKYKTMNLNEIYIDVIKMLVLFRMKDDHTTKINRMYLEIFGPVYAEGASEINEAYVKDTNNRQKILDKLKIKTRKMNIDKSSDTKIESNESIDKSRKINIYKSSDKKIESNESIDKPTIESNSINTNSQSINTNSRLKNNRKPNRLIKSLLVVGGGLLISRFNENKK